MQDLAQCEYSLCNLGVSKKNVDHGAAGAEVPLKTLHTPYIGFSYIYMFYTLLQIISKQNLRDAGVIGNARAAELYGLNILECNFQVVKTFCMLYIKFIVFPTDEVHNNGYFCCD
jgi:arogenate/prephenate dehydratase